MGNLSTPRSVQKLQTALHAKAKAEAGYRFYALYDKISREDILAHAYAQCRSNKGAPQLISSAPFDRDLELAVVDKDEHHALVFPCRRVSGGRMNAGSKKRIDVSPTHWREWVEKR